MTPRRLPASSGGRRLKSRGLRPIPAAVRREVLARDGDACVLCRRRGPGLHLHHVISRNAGGPSIRTNLLTLCGACHRAYHDGHIPRQRIVDALRRQEPPEEVPPCPQES